MGNLELVQVSWESSSPVFYLWYVKKNKHRKAACWFTESSCTMMHFLIDASQLALRQLAKGNLYHNISWENTPHLMYILLSLLLQAWRRNRQVFFMDVRIHSSSGWSVKFECRAFPAISTIGDVVMEDSMHNMAAMTSSCVTSLLHINLACAAADKNKL